MRSSAGRESAFGQAPCVEAVDRLMRSGRRRPFGRHARCFASRTVAVGGRRRGGPRADACCCVSLASRTRRGRASVGFLGATVNILGWLVMLAPLTGAAVWVAEGCAMDESTERAGGRLPRGVDSVFGG